MLHHDEVSSLASLTSLTRITSLTSVAAPRHRGPRVLRLMAIAILAATASFRAGCGGSGGYGGGGTGPGGGGGNTVTVSNNVFTPNATTVTAGTAVTWQWSSGGIAHNVTFDDGQTSGDKSSGAYTRTFGTAGTYPYHCTIHGPSMSGSVVVQ